MPVRLSADAIEELVAELPLRALVAFSACSARLVKAKAEAHFAGDGRNADAVRLAIALAERTAAGEEPDEAELNGVGEAVVEALMQVGTAAAEADDDATREAAFATNCAYAAADAAAALRDAAAAEDAEEDARRVFVAATTGWEAARSVDPLLGAASVAARDELKRQIAAGGGEPAAFPDVGPPIDFARVAAEADRARAVAADAAESDRSPETADLKRALAEAEAEIGRLREEAAARPGSEDDGDDGPDRDREYADKFARLARLVARLSARRAAAAIECERARREIAGEADAISEERARLDEERERLAADRETSEAERAALDAEKAEFADELARWHETRGRHERAVASLRDACDAFAEVEAHAAAG